MGDASTTVSYDPDREIVVKLTIEEATTLFASRTTQRPAGTALRAVHDESVHVEGQGAWTREMIRRLAASISSPELRAAISVIASKAPQPVSYEMVLADASVERHKLRAEFVSLSKLGTRLFGSKHWPFEKRRGLDTSGHMGYQMPEQIAKWWRECTAAALPASAAPPRSAEA